MGIFRDTTQVAIQEMIAEFGQDSRFGRVYSSEDLAAAADRLAAFFEMTLNLRSQYGAPQPGPAAPSGKSARDNASNPPRDSSAGRPNRLGLSSGYTQEPQAELEKSRWSGKTRLAQEILPTETKTPESPRDAVVRGSEVSAGLFRLPRKKIGFNDEERERFAGYRK